MPATTNIVMLSAEAFPYAKAGGLGDVAGALPKALAGLGTRAVLVIPAYGFIPHAAFGIVPYRAVPGFDVPVGPGFCRADIYHGKLPGTQVDVFLIGNDDYFGRDGIYDDPITRESYPDNMQRFVFFAKSALELLERLGEPFDVVHCHDWQTALVPAFLRIHARQDSWLSSAGALFTIHNAAYQGVFPKESLYWAGFDYRFFYPTSPFEFWGRVNFMKVAVEFSDLLNTVSHTYAREIQSSAEFGHGLEGVLRRRHQDLFGIVNGIDYGEWDPATDPLIPAQYSSADLAGKAICKAELIRYFGLPQHDSPVPLVGIVSRLAAQKGFELIEEAIDEIAALGVQLVVLGKGQTRYHEMLERIAARNPRQVAVRIAFDNALAHRIEAGCDMFLMPSYYEPCGLNQLYSLRYGTVPIVRRTGGLADTVSEYDPHNDSGTGFTFGAYSAREMLSAIRRALDVYPDRSRWERIMRRGMEQDWSWEVSARRYLELYAMIRERRHPRPVPLARL